MKFTPKTEEQLKKEAQERFALLPDGDYPFTVLESNEKASKSAKNKGRMMFEVKLNVHGPDGDYHIFDYFSDWFSEWKMKHFADTTGQAKAYEAGTMDGTQNAFAGKVGYATIKTRPAKGEFAAQNEVKDYVVRGSAAVPAAKPDDSDDVGF